MKKKKKKKRVTKGALSLAILWLFFSLYYPISSYDYFATYFAYKEGCIEHHDGIIVSWDHETTRQTKGHSKTIYYFQLDNGIKVSIDEYSAKESGIEHRDVDNLVGELLSFEYVVVAKALSYPLLAISNGNREIVPRSILVSRWSGAVRNTTNISIICISLAGCSILISYVCNAYPDWKRSWKRKQHKRKMQRISLDAKNNTDKPHKTGGRLL